MYRKQHNILIIQENHPTDVRIIRYTFYNNCLYQMKLNQENRLNNKNFIKKNVILGFI